MPDRKIAHARTAADLGKPKVEEARLAEAQQHAREMNDQSDEQRPDRLEDQEEFGRDHRIGDEIAIGDPGEHLRPRQRDKHRIALHPVHRSATQAGGGLDARDDAGRAEQDEAAENDCRAIAPVDTPGQHHETNRRDRDHRDYRCNGAEQRPLEPLDRRHENARTLRVSKLLCLGCCGTEKSGQENRTSGNFSCQSHQAPLRPNWNRLRQSAERG